MFIRLQAAKSQSPLLKLQPQIDILNKPGQSGRFLQILRPTERLLKKTGQVGESRRVFGSEKKTKKNASKSLESFIFATLKDSGEPRPFTSLLSQSSPIRLYEAGTS